MVGEREPQYNLIECFYEVAVEQLLFIQSFTDNPANKLEQRDVIRLDNGLGVRIVSGACVGLHEEGKVRIEDLLADEDKPLSSEPSLVNPLLVCELNAHLPFPLITCQPLKLLIRVGEDLVSPDLEVEILKPILFLNFLDLTSEQ